MQKEITKRVKLYGIAAILLAIILVSVCYQLGYIPQTTNPNINSAMSTFSSFDELRTFLKSRSSSQWGNQYYESFNSLFLSMGPVTNGLVPRSGALSEGVQGDSGKQYSNTNVQVAGVDEADMVKTDGEYIYLISGNNVSILRAYPPENAELVYNIPFTNMTPVGIYINDNKLAVLCTKYSPVYLGPLYYSKWNYFNDIGTYVKVYDISNKTQPDLIRDYQTNGGYFNSRMLDDYVYFVTSQPAYSSVEILPNLTVDKVNLPKIETNGYSREAVASEIYYANISDNYFVFTTIFALDMKNATQPPSSETIMLGGTSTMYVSLNNLYITFPQNDKTTIYRVHITNSTITPEAHGEIPGQILNQFSMDERGNDFRVATQTWNNSSPSSNVFILDMNLSIVGQLQDIEVGETMDSARFIENRCYLSTSVVKRDPFFVIDVENVTAPQILGYLKIPGFTRYLHPYDSNHLIGVGRDGSNNVRVSLFDVSNVSAPKNISEYTFEADWSDTPVLNEHKAFLFDYSKDLLAFPVSLNYYSYNYSSMQTQPLMVFNITLEGGLVLKGNITQQGTQTNEWDYSHYVQRSLYIENVLYTISQAEVQLNNLDDLAFLKEIEIG
jgi:uncharacterized secreted protein with C-terminal beta-propeller domain